MSVHEPACATLDLPPVGGRIGPEPEDFRVDEIPAYVPAGSGEHLYVRLEKRAFTTPAAVREIARAAGVSERDVGYAGLKDRHAVTSQWLSLPGRARPPEGWELPDGLRVLEASRHGNKLRTGHLAGNRFRIALTDVSSEALVRASALVERLGARGLPNHFGPQRFGRGGENLPRALEWLRTGARQRLSAFLFKLFPSVVQADVFNRYLTLRAAERLDRLLAGEIVRLDGSAASFLVEDAERAAPRLASRDVHLTGPLPGSKQKSTQGRPRELEMEAELGAGLDAAARETLERLAPGTRRDLVVIPSAFGVTEPAPGRLLLDFSLPAGSYATLVVRELTRAPFLEATGPAED
jgi:tRNA pseudouridine13 synthase